MAFTFHDPRDYLFPPLQARTTQELVAKNNAGYELWRDATTNLEYVRINQIGAQAIADIYFDKYGIDIMQAEFRIPGNSQHSYTRNSNDNAFLLEKNPALSEKFKLALNNLRNNQSKFLVYYLINENGYVMHAIPIIISKNNEGKTTLVDFERYFSDKNLTSFGIDRIVNVENYQRHKNNFMQNDHHSCTVFALDTLKNCAMDESFLQATRNMTLDSVSLGKMTLGQNSSIIGQLSDEKHKKYVAQINGHPINLKAFYKGHQYASMLDSEHFLRLSNFSLEQFQRIDKVRHDYKTNWKVQEAADAENMLKFSPHISLKPIKALQMNAKNIWHEDLKHNPKASRANNFKVEKHAYKNQAEIEDVMLNILRFAAKNLSFDEVKQGIILAKEKGGIAHKFVGENDSPYKNDLSTLKEKLGDELAKKLNNFSATFQAVCKEMKIFQDVQAQQLECA